jgi:hypothetical protein
MPSSSANRVPIAGRSSPELALSHPFGLEQNREVDAYANAHFYTDNTSYHGREFLRQQPLPGIEGHASYSLTEKFWASLDARIALQAVNTAYFVRLQIHRGTSRTVGVANCEQVQAFSESKGTPRRPV